MQLEECMGWTLQMVTKAVAAMAQTVFCADLQDNIELQIRLMQSVLDAEAETAVFMQECCYLPKIPCNTIIPIVSN